jgi:excinuclease ABC subunit C
MPVWLPDGTIIATRTSAAQLADLNRAQLGRLLTRLRTEMTAAAAELDFEQAARLRDEVAAVEAELTRREA